MDMREITVTSTLDGTSQPSLYYHPGEGEPVPLVVGLHTWSYDRFNQQRHYLSLCRERRYALLLPEFRGPNLDSNPHCADACGSAKAVGDVLDAVRQVAADPGIDRGNIFLLGCSGGGQMALLAAEAAPELFRAVEAWCPVTDLERWHRYAVEAGKHYARHIEACTGGDPGEYARRSPATHPERLARLPVSIHHGRHDTVVPFRHSVAFAERVVAAGNDRVYLDIFDGGHEQIPARSFEWFAKLAGKRSGTIRITG